MWRLLEMASPTRIRSTNNHHGQPRAKQHGNSLRGLDHGMGLEIALAEDMDQPSADRWKAGEHQEVQELQAVQRQPRPILSNPFRTFMIHAANPFNLVEDSMVKTGLSVVSSGHMGVDQLNNKA
ncbi:unnamed protein product, partial [Ectocarpus sp. 13 AM-2016]